MSIRSYNQPVSPTAATVDCARKALDELHRPGTHFALVDAVTGAELALSEQVHDLLRQMLTGLARNRPIAIVPLDHELTPNQAADMLNVSRGYVLRRIAAGELPARMVGTHHRITLDDLLAYKQRSETEREQAMNELVALGQELGLD